MPPAYAELYAEVGELSGLSRPVTDGDHGPAEQSSAPPPTESPRALTLPPVTEERLQSLEEDQGTGYQNVGFHMAGQREVYEEAGYAVAGYEEEGYVEMGHVEIGRLQ